MKKNTLYSLCEQENDNEFVHTAHPPPEQCVDKANAAYTVIKKRRQSQRENCHKNKRYIYTNFKQPHDMKKITLYSPCEQEKDIELVHTAHPTPEQCVDKANAA